MSKDEHAWNKWKSSKSQQNKEIGKNQIEMLERKTTITEIYKEKNTTDGLRIRMEMTGMSLWAKDRSIDIIQSDNGLKNRLKF